MIALLLSLVAMSPDTRPAIPTDTNAAVSADTNPAISPDTNAATPGAALAAPAGAADAGPAPSTAATGLPEAHPMSVRTSVQPEEVTLGEQLTFTVEVDHDPRDTYSLPEKIDAAPLALVGTPASARKDAAGLTTTTFRLTFADVSTLEPRVPGLTLRADGPSGPRELRVPGRPLKLHSLVTDEGADNAEHAHHGPKPPVDVLVRSLLWLWVLLGAGALVAAAVVVRRALARRKLRREATPVVAVLPDEEAIARLSSLKDAAPWQRGEGRAAIFSLSEITRGYLGRRLDFNALDLTSDELLGALRERRLPGLDLALLEDEVRWEDLVKFAKVEPLPEECLRGIERALSLVSRTRPARPAAGEPGPPEGKAA